MKTNSLLLTLIGTIALAGAVGGASVLSVRKVAKLDGTDKDVWAKVGGFCSIKDWHPALSGCDETKVGNETFRTLTLKEGGKIKEKLTGQTETGYTYQIIESPLPVKEYFATFSARSDGDEPGKTLVVWSATFQSNGKPDSEARSVIEGIFNDGLTGLSKR